MNFRQLVVRSLGVGLLAGMVLSLLQTFGVTPIILQAEQYEVAAPQATTESAHSHSEHSHAAHDHGEAWAPADGTERTVATLLSNVFVAMGFAALVLGFMNLYQYRQGATLSIPRGLLWGCAGFFAFFLAPSLGMPPEIPGAQAADLSNRQGWWVLTVATSLVGIAAIVLLKGWRKVFGSLLLVMPHLIGAPHYAGPMFTHPEAEALTALQELHHQFILASGFTNLAFWLVLGATCAWCMAQAQKQSNKANVAT